MVTTSKDKTARIWDAKTGAAIATLSGHTNVVESAAFSPDGTRVVTASLDDTARPERPIVANATVQCSMRSA